MESALLHQRGTAVYQRSVLIVEDEPFIRGLLADRLENDGFEVSLANNTAEARKIASSKDLDVVVLDIDLGWSLWT